MGGQVRTVLVADDAELNLHVTEVLLRSYNLSVEPVISGREAVERVKSGRVYDIIFMDHMMPGMDGIEAVGLIRGLGYTAPIVALTSNAEPEQMPRFLESGFNDIVAKPIDPDLLDAVLRRFIRDIGPGLGSDRGPSVSDMMARSFVIDARKHAATLETLQANGAYGDEGMRGFTSSFHALKGVLANVYELELSKTAHWLEQAGRIKDRPFIQSDTPLFLAALQRVIGRYEARRTAGDGEAGDADLLRAHMDAIIGACEGYDKKTIKTSLAALNRLGWPPPVRERLDAMADLLLCGDYAGIARIAEAIPD